jgi:hypothetical protein
LSIFLLQTHLSITELLHSSLLVLFLLFSSIFLPFFVPLTRSHGEKQRVRDRVRAKRQRAEMREREAEIEKGRESWESGGGIRRTRKTRKPRRTGAEAGPPARPRPGPPWVIAGDDPRSDSGGSGRDPTNPEITRDPNLSFSFS